MPDPAAEADPIGHARTDMLDLLAAVQKRLSLPALPIEPPSVDTITTAINAALTHRGNFNDELIALIESLADRLPKWLVRDLIDEIHTGVSGDALGALHHQLTERDTTLTADERETWHRLSHHNELGLTISACGEAHTPRGTGRHHSSPLAPSVVPLSVPPTAHPVRVAVGLRASLTTVER